MNTEPLRSVTPTIDIYIKLAQYPVLSDKIRVRMREELFRRGVISAAEFEQEITRKAQESQAREGFGHEEANVWQRRKERIRDYQTDAYFANNLGTSLLEQLIDEVLGDQPTTADSYELTFNPEIAPWELLFRQGEIYEAMPPPEQEKIRHHLEEIKVVLIKRMISDQLPFIGVAKNVFDIVDLRLIYNRLIGTGKIGGKAAGMALAWKILQQSDPALGPDLSGQVDIPESYFIGSEVTYDFRLMNNLDHHMNQKYRPLDEIKREYPKIVADHLDGRFPEDIVNQLRSVLRQVGNSPIIVRSSSLLEDNFGFSFAGKYETYFCPNQGTLAENLDKLLQAIKRIYASSLNPDAILYRQKHGLIDYDERMAVLVQKVKGERYGRYFFPTIAGVGFSQNPFRWHPKIRREDGFVRIVWGLGTRAVTRIENDYPRMVALSHPRLRPEADNQALRQYTQRMADVIDMEDNAFVSLPVADLLQVDYPHLRAIASLDRGDYIQEIVSIGGLVGADRLTLTFNNLLRDRKLIKLLRTTLMRLEHVYQIPVDVEFTISIIPNYPYPDYRLHILQCRPLSQRLEEGQVTIPENIPEENILFTTSHLIPDGRAAGIRYVVYVDPEAYRQVPNQVVQQEVGRAVGRLNKILEDEAFILMGPGRWGSVNPELGVHVTYADIYNTKVLIELALAKNGVLPELSYGTHFFQDLVESGIHSLPLILDEDRGYFDWNFFRNSPNVLGALSPPDDNLADYLRVIDVTAVFPGRQLTILMDGSQDKAVGFLTDKSAQSEA